MRYLVRLPWTIVPEMTPEGDRLLRVRELPAATGHGETDVELEADFWESLTETLRCYIHFGDRPPLPASVASLPWEQEPPTPARYFAPLGGGPAMPRGETTTSFAPIVDVGPLVGA